MRIAVIGAGIQGCSVALAAADRSVDVDLLDINAEPMAGASLHTEGKIHLGFVYALDATLGTSALMARGAAVFSPLVSRWLGVEPDDFVRSTPFFYAVHKKSMVDPIEIADTYERISRQIRHAVDNHTYFGIEHPHEVTGISPDEADGLVGDAVAAVFRTREIAVEPKAMAHRFRAAVIEHPSIRFVPETSVVAVDRVARRLETVGESMGPYDHIVNCAWAGRPTIDRTADIPIVRASHRMKYYLRTSARVGTPSAPSLTIVVGPFGDIVRYRDGSQFLSWYPVGRRGFSSAVAPPPWPPVLYGEDRNEVIEGTVQGLEGILPDGHLSVGDGEVRVEGGSIYAAGETDIDDRSSLLHQRTLSGVVSYGRYHTVDTGKYTTAPLFASDVVERICGG